MSLLLDALKRAEQEKLARGGNEPAKPARAPESSGFDMESPRMAPISAPVLELQPVDSPASAPAAAAASAEAKAVQNAFAAKAAAAPQKRQRMALWLGLAGIVVLVAGAGGYVWYSIQQLTPPPFSARGRPRPPAAPPPPVASVEPSSAAKMEQLVALANAKPAGPPVGVVTPIAPDAAPPASKPDAPPAASAPAASPASGQRTLEALLREAQRAPEPEPFSLQRSDDKPRVPAQVSAGYEALTLGDLERARREYAAAVAAEPGNIDAQLGLATVEARAGHRALAASLYRRALDIDPRDPTALAGLAALSAPAAPDGLESSLRADLARAESGPLHFALANLYASQGRWSEAQAEYFEAHRFSPDDADVLFDLAVSLDHLGQARLAAGYYERAIDAASRRAAQFDAATATRRLAELRAAAHP